MSDGTAVLPREARHFSGRILFVGFGSIGRGLLPLLFRHFSLDSGQIRIIAADDTGRPLAAAWGCHFLQACVTEANYRNLLAQHVGPGDVVLNLAVEVSSLDVLCWCQEHGVIYLDTGIEPWQGGYADPDPLRTTNCWLRAQALAARGDGRPTAVLAHGANPGLVSHLLKNALAALAGLRGLACEATPDWGQLARALDIRVIHIAERDTQSDGRVLQAGEFACTWSVDGLIAEAAQPAELGWGTHEKGLLPGMQIPTVGSRCSVYWPHGGRLPRLCSWVPSIGEQTTWLITHNEAISLADYLSVYDAAGVAYRPTVAYAYRPCLATRRSLHAWEATGLAAPARKTLIAPESIREGSDELGVLLCFPGGAYWYGSTLDIVTARRLAPHNNATTLQVAAGMLGGLAWALCHPREGVVEAEQMDHRLVLAVAGPYLGRLSGHLTDWQPQAGGSLQLAEFIGTEAEHDEQDATAQTGQDAPVSHAWQ